MQNALIFRQPRFEARAKHRCPITPPPGRIGDGRFTSAIQILGATLGYGRGSP